MKKLMTVLSVLLLLAACSQKGYSKLSDGSEIIFTGPDNANFTKNDLYDSLKIVSVDAVEEDLINRIANLEGFDLSNLEAEADGLADMYIEMGYESYLIQYYGSVDAFKDNYVYSGILVMLANTYVTDNYDKFKEEDKPVKMKMAHFDTKEAAGKVIEDVNNGSTFEMACANNGYEDEVSEAVYIDSDSALDYYVKEYLNNTDEIGLSTVIESSSVSGTSTSGVETKYTYYVLDVSARDVDSFKDEYIAVKVEKCDENEIKKYMFTKHDIQFFDQDIYELMKAEYEVFE